MIPTTTSEDSTPIGVAIIADVASSLREAFAADPRFAVVERIDSERGVIAAAARGCAVLVTRHHNRVDAELLDALPALRVIAQATSGTDNIDLEAARGRGITIVSTPGANANAVAEYVIAQLLALSRTIPQYDAQLRRGEWSRRDCATRHELSHYRLGIVGLGNVGRRVAALARNFGMEVAAYDPYLTDADFEERSASRVSTLAELLGESSALSLHAPLTSETRGMIGERELMSLPRGSLVVSPARGELLDFAALLRALETGHIAGAACDVFDPEPAQFAGELPPNLILTPHVAGCTAEAKEGAGLRLYGEVCEALGLRTWGKS